MDLGVFLVLYVLHDPELILSVSALQRKDGRLSGVRHIVVIRGVSADDLEFQAFICDCRYGDIAVCHRRNVDIGRALRHGFFLVEL